MNDTIVGVDSDSAVTPQRLRLATGMCLSIVRVASEHCRDLLAETEAVSARFSALQRMSCSIRQ